MDFGPALFNPLQALVAIYAVLRGGGPERTAATLQVCAALATMASYTVPGSRFFHFESGTFVIDLLLFAGLYALALRSNRIWPMLMAAFQLSSILVHLARLVDWGMSPWAYAFLLKIWGYPMVLLLGIAVYRHRARVRQFGIDLGWSK